LRNPIYAGAYVYGRRPTVAKKKKPGRPSTGRTVAKFGEWEVLLKDRLPSYITWDQFEKNKRQLESNTAQGTGAPRNGPSLLSGLLICGRCGMRMTTQYSNNGNGLRYSCSRLMVDYGEPLCQSLAGKPLDELTSKLVLQSLEPAALEISLKVAEEIETERCQMRSHWDKKLERARYTVERAFRQYSVVEPENRLVARALERQWEEALVAEEELKMEYERFLSQQAAPLSEEEREAIRQLAVNIPEIWNADSTTASDQQAIVRQLIERIIVTVQGESEKVAVEYQWATVQGESEKVAVEYQWAGGHKTQATLIRPVARLEQLSYYQDLLKRVAELNTQQKNARTIAHILNEEGWRPAKRRDTFNAYMVHSLLSRQGLRVSRKKRPSDGITKKANEWTIRELSQKLKMPEPTLYSWIKKGLVKSRRALVSGRTVLIINANRTEINRLRSLRSQPRTWSKHIHTLKEEKG
jgi:hypothetical protein